MLIAVKKMMEEKYVANLEQIAAHIQQSPDHTRALVDYWIRKGRIEKLPNPAGCGTRCQQCKPKDAEVYKWLANNC